MRYEQRIEINDGSPATLVLHADTEEEYRRQFNECAKIEVDCAAREGLAACVKIYMDGEYKATYQGRNDR